MDYFMLLGFCGLGLVFSAFILVVYQTVKANGLLYSGLMVAGSGLMLANSLDKGDLSASLLFILIWCVSLGTILTLWSSPKKTKPGA